VRDGHVDLDDVESAFERLSTKSPPRRRASAKVASPSRFRLVGMFRSQSTSQSHSRSANVSVAVGMKPQPLLLRKKGKMRDLG
jgi:hypothetical protein